MILETNPHNPRTISKDAYEKLKASIERNPDGLTANKIAYKDGIIISGNQRYRALTELGLEHKKEWFKDLSGWTQEQIDEWIIQSNISAGEWDWDILANEWEQTDLEEWGVDTSQEWDNKKDLPEDIDDIPEVKTPVSKLGDLWLLDGHRVLCGDSTDKTTVERLMDGKKADMVFTDPPYGMGKEKDGVLGDNQNSSELLQFNKTWIPISFNNLKETGSWYCWGIIEPLMDIYSEILKPMIKTQQITWRNLITWRKGAAFGISSSEMRSYPPDGEKCIFVMCGVQGFNNNSDNYYEGWESIRDYLNQEMNKMGGRSKWKEALGNQMGSHYFTKSQWVFPTREAYEKLQKYANGRAFKKDYDELKKDYDELKKDWQKTRAYFNNTHEPMTDIWEFSITSKTERAGLNHATPKPIALCSRAINSSSQEKGIVLDIFLGSGSTLIACEQTDRKCYGIELDPKYVDVICKRWQTLTGQMPILESTGETHDFSS